MTVRATRSVTVLFTDLVRSTELPSSLSLVAAEDIRRTHFAALRGPLLRRVETR
jgi:class 3 adenylate cyclase